jgi:hypothetical protein
MVGEKHGVQAVGRVDFGAVVGKLADPCPAFEINRGHNHRIDARPCRSIDDGIPIMGKCVVVKVDMAVDQSSHAVDSVDWQRVPPQVREDNATGAS